MAELIIKTSTKAPDPAWQDGDIIHAMNDLHIHDVHAQHICHKNLVGFNSDGLRPANSLTEDYLSEVRQYKFERISQTEVRRSDLFSMSIDVFSDTPNGDGEYIDVPLFISRWRQHPKHVIFGKPGTEIWYGGRTLITTAKINDIWVSIEAKTAYLKAHFGKFPWGNEDQKHHLAITVDDFDNTVRSELESSVYDGTVDPPVMTERRKNAVDWRNLPGLTQKIIDDTLASDVKVDIRNSFSFTRSLIIDAKPV